jgi:tetratricopeptide (TPR) repeat protein
VNIDAWSAKEVDSLIKETAKETLLQLNPLLFAACLYTNGETESAIQVARRQVAIQTSDKRMMAAAYEVWGDALQKQLDFEEALVIYKAAEALDSRNSDTHKNLGTVYASMATNESPNMSSSASKRNALFGDAIAEYELAVNADPKNADAYRNWSIVYRNQHDFPTAIKKITQAIELAPGDPGLYDDLAATLKVSKLTGWEERAKDAIEKAYALRLVQPERPDVGACVLNALPGSNMQEY